MRDENINRPKRYRTEPKNTLILTQNIDAWRKDLKMFEKDKNLRVLYLEGGELVRNINFYSYEVVVSTYSNLKLPSRGIKGVKGHEWHRLLIDKVDSVDNDAKECILNLKVVNKWVVTEDGVEINQTQQQFLYELLFGSAKNVSMSIQKELLQAYTVQSDYFQAFGSNVIETLSIEHTYKERELYMVAQNWGKDHFQNWEKGELTIITNPDDVRKHAREQLEMIQYLELLILKLRDMASNLSLRLKKEGNIEEHSDAVKRLKENPYETCLLCGSSSMIIITKCGHFYCEFCWYKWWCCKDLKKKCGSCRTEIFSDYEIFFSKPLDDCPSSKANRLVEHLKKIPTSESKSSMVISCFERLYRPLDLEDSCELSKLQHHNNQMGSHTPARPRKSYVKENTTGVYMFKIESTQITIR